MSKKYTIMIFDSAKYGKSKTLTVSTKPLWALAIFMMLLMIIAAVFGYSSYKLYTENNMLRMSSGSYIDVEGQMSTYSDQLQEITKKVVELDELEYKIRDLMSFQTTEKALKQVAVGGKEVDILQGYFATSDRREDEFFSNLEETLVAMSMELDQRELSLSELVDFLEEQRLMMLSTPTIWPVYGWVSSQYGFRSSPFTGKRTFHEGLDIAARYGLPVYSTAKGVVVFAGERAGYGKLVTVDHGYGYMTRYAHNSSLTVKAGDKVSKGDVIAKVGSTGQSTGPHVHYEVLVNGIPVNPIKFIIENN